MHKFMLIQHPVSCVLLVLTFVHSLTVTFHNSYLFTQWSTTFFSSLILTASLIEVRPAYIHPHKWKHHFLSVSIWWDVWRRLSQTGETLLFLSLWLVWQLVQGSSPFLRFLSLCPFSTTQSPAQQQHNTITAKSRRWTPSRHFKPSQPSAAAEWIYSKSRKFFLALPKMPSNCMI